MVYGEFGATQWKWCVCNTDTIALGPYNRARCLRNVVLYTVRAHTTLDSHVSLLVVKVREEPRALTRLPPHPSTLRRPPIATHTHTHTMRLRWGGRLLPPLASIPSSRPSSFPRSPPPLRLLTLSSSPMLIFCSFSSSSLDTVIEVGECDAAGAMAGGLSAEAPPGPNLAVCMPCTTSKKGACVCGEDARNKEEG